MSSETVELAIENLTCQKCVSKIQSALTKVDPSATILQAEIHKQSVVVSSTLPTSKLLSIIENDVGKRAVIMGMGSTKASKPLGAAVSMLGGIIGCGSQIQGVIRFTQTDTKTCVIDGTIDGLTPGEHGLAIHECGDLSGGCNTVGHHYNPRNVRHGSPVDNEDARHVGDLGNVIADEKGRAEFKFVDNLVKVNDIIGRSIVVSSDPDDFGKGSSELSLVSTYTESGNYYIINT